MTRKIRIRGYKNDTRPKTYQEWTEDHSGITAPPHHEWDGSQPWAQKPISALEEDYIEALEALYPTLKGRQKQIVALLLEGTINHSKKNCKLTRGEIGRQLGIARKDVVIHLRRIAKKILKSVRGSADK